MSATAISHVALVVDSDDPGEYERANELSERLVHRAIAMDGTCTGEHGVGMGKMDFLIAEHGEAVSVMRTLKNAIDPDNIMNPGENRPGLSARRSHHLDRTEFADIRAPDLTKAPVEFVLEEPDRLFGARSTAGRYAIERRPADEGEIGAESQGLGDVGPTADAAVDGDHELVADRLADFGQDVDWRRGGVELTPAMV